MTAWCTCTPIWANIKWLGTRCQSADCACALPQALYLDPLLERVRANQGLVYPQSRYLGMCTVLTLMVDVKDTPQQAPERSFDIIHKILQSYAGGSHYQLTWIPL